MIVEICANSFESALAAQNAGADRIELCTNLSVGGITPPYTEIEKVVSELTIPTHVLIRPRRGDFCYTKTELKTMLKDIAFCKKLGCAGIVSGVLTSERDIDTAVTKQLIEVSEGLEFTFHRAIDQAREHRKALREVILMGATRVLSSGQQLTALEGISVLKEMKIDAEGKIQIMPGGGINSQNALAFQQAGFDMIHFSATKKTSANGMFNTKVEGHSDPVEIQRIIQLLS